MADANPTPSSNPAPTGPLPDATPKNQKPMAEFTLQAVLLGVAIGIVMTAANVYLGLKAGMTVSASIPAAVISMGILRGLMKRGTILENNIVQTIGSAGESLAAGIIFTIPALVILGVWEEFHFWPTTLIAVLGGLLGIVFMIPIRKALIVEEKELTYPEGVACAQVLEAGEKGGSGLILIAIGMGVGAVVKLLTSGFGVLSGTVAWGFRAGRTAFGLGCDVSPALLAVGYIVGLNVAVLVFIGGLIAWGIGIPCYILDKGYDNIVTKMVEETNKHPETVFDTLSYIAKTDIRYLGVGAMIVGGLWSIFSVRKGMLKGLQGIAHAFRNRKKNLDVHRTEQDLSVAMIAAILTPTLIGVFGLYWMLTGAVGITITAGIIMVIAAFFFVAVSSYIVGLVGSSNNPVSGMTISTMLLACLILTAFHMTGTPGILAALGIAGVVCCAACTAGDVSQDLKTGHLVGATPYKQQIGQVIGVLSAAAFIAPVLTLLHKSYGIGEAASENVEALAAPQASLFAGIADAFFGEGDKLPANLVLIGAGIGVALIICDSILKKRGSSFRTYVMPVAVGIYLPWALSVPILLGGIASWITRRRSKPEQKNEAQHRGIMVGSGLIAGEAIMGILIALWLVLPAHAKPSIQTAFSVFFVFSTLSGLIYLALRVPNDEESTEENSE